MGITIHKRQKKYMQGAYDYISNMVDKAVKENKKIIVWGVAKGGAWIKHLVETVDGRIKIDFFIDEFMEIPFAMETNIYRSSKLDYIDANDYIILSSILNNKAIEPIILEHGFVKRANYFDVREDIKGSNFDYIASCFDGLDFEKDFTLDNPHAYSPYNNASIDYLMTEVAGLTNPIKIIDYGCGKGQILLAAYMSGIDKLVGIELNEKLCNYANRNMEILNIPATIINGDATQYNDLDDINVFFFYNPFGNPIFRRVIDNIEESIKRNPRKALIVYGNPFCHKTVIENGIFKLVKQLHVDVHDPILNIYGTEL